MIIVFMSNEWNDEKWENPNEFCASSSFTPRKASAWKGLCCKTNLIWNLFQSVHSAENSRSSLEYLFRSCGQGLKIFLSLALLVTFPCHVFVSSNWLCRIKAHIDTFSEQEDIERTPGRLNGHILARATSRLILVGTSRSILSCDAV